jgi:hypothetical protein
VQGGLVKAEQMIDSVHLGAKNATFAPFIYENEHFAKTGSGQT